MNAQYIARRGRSRNNHDEISMEHYYRVDIFLATIDYQLQELHSRFNDHTVELLVFNDHTVELLVLSTALDLRNGVILFKIDNICKLAEKFYPNDFMEQELVRLRIEFQHFELNIPNHPELQELSVFIKPSKRRKGKIFCSVSVSLVSKRWLRLLRSSTVALALTFIGTPHAIPSLSSFLSHHPYLSSLSLTDSSFSSSSSFSHHLLQSLASSCPNLRHLRFLVEPVSGFSLLSLSNSCPHLSSLIITLSRPLCFQWIAPLRALKDLSVFITESETELFSCKKLEKLKLKSCECVGDNVSFSAFIKGLETLKEVELRTSRTLADGVLLKLARGSVSLSSLLVYNGGSKEGLLQFISHSRPDVQKLDLRLPLDLDNDHLIAVAENFENGSQFNWLALFFSYQLMGLCK
ncbi:uncharacterized protein [Coffea arabica]|uniref:Uncharacterized protein n=1 Tax=Coffea arabica TaxID=13443 RepID=A0ABM4UER7_COFAR